MASLRKAHEEGPTRVSISGEYVMTGGSDGVVALFASKRWPQTAALWARQCHSAAVTCVTLEAALQLGFSCGRDGLVVLHENLLSGTDAATARVICRVTGEVRCLCVDAAHRRVFVGGDSLRCLQMGAQRYDIYTIPLIVPHPIVAMAVSPCGNLMAMASASRAIGVLCVTPGRYAGATTASQTDAASQAVDSALQSSDSTVSVASQLTRFFHTRFVFPDLLPAEARRVDGCAYRLSWTAVTTEAATPQALLFVPATAQVRVFRFTVATSAPYRHAMCAIGSLQPAAPTSEAGLDFDTTSYRSALAYAITPHRVMCVMTTDTHLYAVKLDDRTLKATPFFTQGFDTAVTDVDVNSVTGEVIVGLGSGAVSLLRRAAARQSAAVLTAQHVDPSSTGVDLTGQQKATGLSSSVPLMTSTVTGQRATPDISTSTTARVPGGVDETSANHTQRAGGKDEGGPGRRGDAVVTRTGASGGASSSRHGKKKQQRDDSASWHGDSGGDEDGSSASSTSSGKTNSSDSSDAEGLDVTEDLAQVVVDLKRSNPLYDEAAAETERPSRWRQARPEEALVAAAREAARQRSRYLDDEAEEVSSSEAEAEDEAVYEDDGYGSRRRNGTGTRRTATGGHSNDDDDNDGEGGRSDTEDETGAMTRLGDGDDEDDGVTGEAGVQGGAQTGRTPGLTTAAVDYSFQVGATPVGPEGACYLAYNAVGYIHCTREAVTVYFHDVAYPAIRIPEKSATTLMGTLSPVGAGFVLARDEATATEGRRLGQEVDGQLDDSGACPDSAPRLEIYYRTFVALGAQTEWRVRLQPGETVRCLAAGIRFLAVATSRYLRLFSLSGLELAVLSRSARIVTMAATSSRKLMSSFRADFDPLAIAYLQGGAGELMMEVLDVGSRVSVIAPQPLPLTEAAISCDDGSGAPRQERAHQLQWLGWSEDGPLHTVDTAGVVRLFTENWGGGWVPVFDPRLLPDQSYHLWVWNVSDEYLFAYRAARDTTPYPAAAATGLPSEHVRLFLPLARTGSERTLATWDHLLRREVRTDELKRHSTAYTEAIAKHDALHDKKIMELFQLALRDQQTTRALDLATMLELRDNVELCAKQANSEGHVQLVHKLMSLYDLRMKAKAKRKCTLPLENTLVTERERDLLLRRLLAKEKAGHHMSASDTAPRPVAATPAIVNSAATSLDAASASERATEQGTRGVVAERKFDSVSGEGVAVLADSPGKSSINSAPSTVTTMTTRSTMIETNSTTTTMPSILKAAHPAAERAEGLPVRRHVTFNLGECATASQATQITTTVDETDAVRPVTTKPVNPFAHKVPLRSTTLRATSTDTNLERTAAERVKPCEAMQAAKSVVMDADIVGRAAAVEKGTQMRPKPVNAREACGVKGCDDGAVGQTQISRPQRTLLRTPHSSSQPTSCARVGQERSVTLLGDSQSVEVTPGETVTEATEMRQVSAMAPGTAAPQQLTSADVQRTFITDNDTAVQPGLERSAPHVSPTTAAVATTQLCVHSVTDPFLTLDAAECLVSDTDGAPRIGQADSVAEAPTRSLPRTSELPASAGVVTRNAVVAALASPSTPPAPLCSADATWQRRQMVGEADEEAMCTVQTVLDVGHEDSGMQPRSRSFGEALRKRYREDEDEESATDELAEANLPIPRIVPH